MSFWSVLDNALGAVDAETQHSRGSPRAAPTVRAETGKATIPRSSTLPVSQKATVPGSVAGTGGPASLGGSSGATRRQRVVEAAGPTAEKRGSSASRAGRSANGRSSKKRCVARSASHTVAKPVDEQAPPRLARSKTAAPVLQTPERPSAAAPSTAAGVSLPRQASRLKDDGAFEGCVVWFEASTARRLGKTRMKLFCNKVLPRKRTCRISGRLRRRIGLTLPIDQLPRLWMRSMTQSPTLSRTRSALEQTSSAAPAAMPLLGQSSR